MSDPTARKIAEKLYGADAPEFPTTEQFEVWEVTETGEQRRVDRWLAAETARSMAGQYQAEADENYRAEAQGPVKPVQRSFVTVRVTENREVVA